MTSTKSAVATIALVAVLVLAGCTGSPTAPASATETVSPADGTVVDDGGTVEFYLSDEKNAIDDFESLEVTITKIGLHRTDAADRTDENATVTPTTANATTTVANETTNATATATPDEQTNVTEREQDQERDRGPAGEEWVEYEVNKTADLTELQGANATKLESLRAPNGSYDKVFVYVDEIEATLTTGEQVNVKLPSSKLHVNKGFTVGNGQNVSFVFDISVHKAGNSGKYILKPVVSESGTSDEVEIRDVDERRGDDRESESDNERPNDRDDDERPNDRGNGERDADGRQNETAMDGSGLSVEFVGPVEAGSNATLTVRSMAGPIQNVTVLVDDETVGVTDGDGTVRLAIPDEREELEVTVRHGDVEREVEFDLDEDGE